MGDNVYTDAHMEFDLLLIYTHFPHSADLKWIFSNVKHNSESSDGVVFHLHSPTMPLTNGFRHQLTVKMDIH